MKKSDKIKPHIYNNYWKAIGVILFIISLFVYSTEYIELLNFSLANPIMSRLECFAYPIVAFVAILIYYIFIAFKIKKQSLKQLIFILIATIIYLCCISSNKWEYETIYGANKLFAYANVLLLIPTLEIVILIRNIVSAKRKDIEAPYFECEYPLEKDESLLDKYNRFPFFKNLASKRLNSSFSKKGAFTMSIVGTWGSGKSTAMNIIKGELENKLLLEGILPKNYQRLGDSILKGLLKQFNAIDMSKIEGDAFGKIYEFFLGKFASAEGQRGGEFFTPTSLVQLIVEVLKPMQGNIYMTLHVVVEVCMFSLANF